jgi:putative methionine-R-sulfoxide reductase with GAF domain
MINYFKNFLASANNQDSDSVKLLRAVLIIVSLSVLGIALLLIFINHKLGSGSLGAFIISLLSGAALFLSYRNIHWVGRLLFPLAALVGLTFMAITTDGLHDSTIMGFTLVIIFTSLLAGQNAIALATVSTLIAIWIVAYADITGISQSLFAKATKINDAIGLATVFSMIQIIAAGSLNALMSRLNSVLENVRRSEKELLENNRELNNIRASLEEKVIERTRAAESARAEAESQAWFTRGQAQLAEQMRGDLDLPTLANNITSHLSRYIGAQTGALFVASGDVLKLTGRYAYVERAHQKSEFRLGESLIGEAAKSKRIIIVDDIPTDAILVSSALGEAMPRQILIAPLESNGQVLGVIEFATLTQFTADHQALLKRVSESVAIALRTVQTRLQMSDLLMRSQQQAEELQAQEEELRASNEELRVKAELKQS